MYSSYSYVPSGSPYGYYQYQYPHQQAYPYGQQGYPYVQQQPFVDYSRMYPMTYPHPAYLYRQQPVRGQATWTEGGKVTKCEIPWSDNQYMTVAVSQNAPYKCGQTLKVRNLATAKEIVVTVVDTVAGYPPNKINLHRKAFEALGATTGQGVINVEITPSPELELEKWGKYLLGVAQTAYPGYSVTDFKSVGKTEVSAEQTKESYDFVLQSPQEQIKVRGTVTYNPKTDRVISFDLKEM